MRPRRHELGVQTHSDEIKHNLRLLLDSTWEFAIIFLTPSGEIPAWASNGGSSPYTFRVHDRKVLMQDSRRPDVAEEAAAFMSSLDDVLSRVSDAVHDSPEAHPIEATATASASRDWQPSVEEPAVSAPTSPSPASDAASTPRIDGTAEIPGTLSSRSRRPVAWLVPCLGLLLAVGATVGLRRVAQPAMSADLLGRLPPPAAGQSASKPSERRSAQTAQQPDGRTLKHDPDASVEVAMLRDLDAAGVFALAPTGGQTPLAIARYDTLTSDVSESQVIAPLHTETIYALVRADSPRRYLHELRGARIDIGEANSPRASSARALYRALFGVNLSPAETVALPKDAALRQLLDGDALDALLVFDAQPSRWLAALPDRDRRRLRLLSLDAADVSTRGALQTYLESTAKPLDAVDSSTDIPALAEVTFLVAQTNSNDAAAAADVARSLCKALPALRRDGDTVWRDVRPSLRLPTGLPASPAAETALSSCKPVNDSS